MKCTGFTLEELAGLQTLTPPPLGGGQTACAAGTAIAARVDSTIPIRANLMFHMADSNPAISRTRLGDLVPRKRRVNLAMPRRTARAKPSDRIIRMVAAYKRKPKAQIQRKRAL